MSRKICKIMMGVLFAIVMVVFFSGEQVYAEELSTEGTIKIKLDYTDVQYAEIVMPSDGYILISQEETMISIGIDSKDESKAIRIYGDEETYKKTLKKGTHKIYLFDGAGSDLFKNEYATIHYAIYIDKKDDKENTATVPRQEKYEYYEIDDSSCQIESYVGETETIVIPDVIDGYTVVAIGEKAFNQNEYAKNITIPATVKKIEEDAFAECDMLSSVVFESDSQLEVIGEGAFNECTNLKEIVIPQSVKKISAYAFFDCKKLPKVTFEKKSQLNTIDEHAFDGCKNLVKLTIPKNVEKIGDSAFLYCTKLSSVTFESGSKLKKIEGEAFSECTSLKKIVIPKNVQTIGGGAFVDCKNLSSITFQSGSKLQKIGRETFLDCIKLKKITLTSKVIKSIGKDAFYGVNKKAVIMVPRSKLTKYKKLLNKKAGYVKSMKIKSKS